MRDSALDIRDSGVVAVWWPEPVEHRAVLGLSSGQNMELVDRLLEHVPGAAAHENGGCSRPRPIVIAGTSRRSSSAACSPRA
jgi:hypothetical protein